MATKPIENIEKKKVELGTFSGVFIPSFLTIMGVIIFLRMGYIMGNAGLVQGLTIIVLANIISILTSLSVSAIATNIQVKGGGVYYLISRSLGQEYGGPIGLVLVLSQAVSVAFYIIGFAEVTVSFFPFLEPVMLPMELVVCGVLFIAACMELDWAARIQFWILVILCLGLVSYMLGAIPRFNETYIEIHKQSQYVDQHSFWTLFAIFFPAITGFTQGASLSGDLKNPGRSIPRGTLAAVGISFIIYLVFGCLVLLSSPRTELLENYMVMKDRSLLPFLIVLGVVSATLSSALTSFLGAPRILQALAQDKVFPFLNIFARGSGPSSTPRRATILTFIIALICIYKGNLNTIAPIVTMFFLMTYGLMNYATFVEDYGKNPSFRPTFRYFHWRLSLAGTVGCFLAMLFINTLAAVFSIGVIAALIWIVDRTVKKSSWGDAKRGFYFSRIKEYLLRLRDEPIHPKNWRPQLLVLSGRPKSRMHLVRMGIWLEAGRGILTLANIITGKIEERESIMKTERLSIREFIEKEKLPIFSQTLVSPNYLQGVEALVQAHSIGGLRPNTVMMGWSGDKEKQRQAIKAFQSINKLGKNIILAEESEKLFQNYDANITRMRDLSIDVWWRGEQNGEMMLLLAYLITQNKECRRSRIRLLRVVETEDAKEKNREYLNKMVEEARINADIDVFISIHPWRDVVIEKSNKTDITFLGFKVPEEGEEDAFLSEFQPLFNSVPTTVLVHRNLARPVEL